MKDIGRQVPKEMFSAYNAPDRLAVSTVSRWSWIKIAKRSSFHSCYKLVRLLGGGHHMKDLTVEHKHVPG